MRDIKSIFIFGFIFLLFSCSGKEDIYKIKVASSAPLEEPGSQALLKFTKMVNERSNGRIEAKLYANGTLGNNRDVSEGLLIGTIEMQMASSSPLAVFVPSLNIFEMPFLFENNAHMFAVLDSDIGNQYRSDYDHVELSVTRDIFTPLTIAVRATEEDGAREYRPTLTQSVINWNVLKDEEGNNGRINLSLGHRIEYRYYETDGVDANWRYRGIAKLGLNVLDDVNIWAKVQPRFEFGEGKEDDFKIDDIKNQVGLQAR